MKETSLRSTLSSRAKSMRSAHVTNVEDRTGCGIPDTILNVPEGLSAFLELKVVKKQSRYARLASGRLRPNQASWLRSAAKTGANAWIISHFVENGITFAIHGSRAREYNNTAYGDIGLLATKSWRGLIDWDELFNLVLGD